MGHFACSCKAKRRCGLCAGEHDTRHCSPAQKDSPDGRFAPLKCALCSRPYAVSDESCSARKEAVDKYWIEVKSTGPYYLLPRLL